MLGSAGLAGSISVFSSKPDCKMLLYVVPADGTRVTASSAIAGAAAKNDRPSATAVPDANTFLRLFDISLFLVSWFNTSDRRSEEELVLNLANQVGQPKDVAHLSKRQGLMVMTVNPWG